MLRIGADGVAVPVLAARFEPAASGALRFWMRDDVRFSDGSAVTLDDVVASLSANHIGVVKENGAVVVSSTDVSLPIDLRVSRAFIFRRTPSGIVGTGPFVPIEQDAEHIVLKRRAPAGHLIDRVTLISYAKPQDAFAHTLKGDAEILPDADARWLEFFENVPRFRIEREPGTHANAVAFNVQRLSRSERIALVAALHAEHLRTVSFGSECEPPPKRLEFKPLPGGRALDIVASPIHERFALALRRELGSRGGDVRILDLQGYFAAIQKGDFDLVAARPLIWPPIVSSWTWRTGASGNVLGYSNAELDAALDRRDWTAAQRALDADPPIAIVCTPPYVVIVDSRVKAASYSLDTLPDWEVAN